MTVLNAATLRSLSAKPGRHRVDDGLYLVVKAGARPSWLFRYVSVTGKRRDMSLGPFDVLSLPDARAEVQRWQQERIAGRDPIEVRRQLQQSASEESKRAVSLREYAKEYHELNRHKWRNHKHAAQWISSLNHLGPLLDQPIGSISSAALLKVLEELNKSHHETATRIRQRLEAVFDRAVIAGIVTANPATVLKRSLRSARNIEHLASLPFEKLPQFIRDLRDCDASQSTRLGFEWLILSAARTNEVQFARWSQINEQRTVWRIDAADMKVEEAHLVPITERMREILKAIEAQRGEGWDWIFPSPQGRKNAMSNGAFLAVIRRMGLAGTITTHGMRSSFSTWANETTQFRSEIVEAALSHDESNAVRAAYNRAQYWQQRVELAEAWEDYCLSGTQ